MKTRWALCVVVVASCFASRKARALAIYDPKIDRMAITDRSTAANVQPRVFLVTVGNETVGSNLLVTKDPDAIQNGWRSTNVNGVTSGLAAVSWTDGTNQRQRVFFAKDNALAMLPNDNDTQSPVVSIAPPQNYTIADTDVAAVTWLDGTTRRMVVATGAKLSGTAGYACLFENADLAPTWSVSCQSTIRTTTTKLDIVGTVVSNSAQFYFKNDAGGLGRLRRTGANATHVYEVITKPNSENLLQSMFAIPSQVSGQLELGVITATNKRVWTGRVAPTSTTPTWTQQPVIPNGDLPASSGGAENVSLAGIKYTGTFGSSYTRTNVLVIANSKIYYTGTNDDAGTWLNSWAGGGRPGDGQVVWGIGDLTTTTPDLVRVPRVYLSAGSTTTTLEEYTFPGFSPVFRDHIRLPHGAVGVGSPATESALSMGAQNGIAAAIRRSDPPPWQIMLRDTTDGANSFSASDIPVVPLGSGQSMTDPVTDFAGGKMHFVALETDLNMPGCGFGGNQRIVYRRGTSAANIAALAAGSPDLFQIATNGTAAYDHPAVVATEDSAGAATAHVIYWDQRNTTAGRYWKLPPSGAAQGPTDIPQLGGGPSDLFRGANQSVYGVLHHIPPSLPFICNLATVPPPASACDYLGGNNGTLSPTTFYVDALPFGPEQPTQQGSCPAIGGKFYKCFDVEQPTSFFPSPTTVNKLYVAYMGFDQGTRSIYFIQSSGGSNFGTWTAPVRIHSRAPTDKAYYIDPSIVVDDEGTISVTYSSINPAPANGGANVYTAWSLDGGVTWSNRLQDSWSAAGLPFHCGRGKWFLGEYRRGTKVGGRANHIFHTGSAFSHEQRTYWVSRWSMP